MDVAPPERFWRSVFAQANADTYRILFGEQVGRMMIAILLFCIYVAILWETSSHDMARGEIILKGAATAAPLLVYPFLLLINFFRSTKRSYTEIHNVHEALKTSLKELPKFEIRLFNRGKQTIGRVTNVGTGQATLNVEIDYSEAGLHGAPQTYVDANWTDGYALSLRVFHEGSRNEFLLREIEQSFERFYGGIGARPTFWDGNGNNKRRRVTLLANASPRPPTGANRIVIETCGEEIIVISGDAKIDGQKAAS